MIDYIPHYVSCFRNDHDFMYVLEKLKKLGMKVFTLDAFSRPTCEKGI